MNFTQVQHTQDDADYNDVIENATKNHYQSVMESVPSLLVCKSAPLRHLTSTSATEITRKSQMNNFEIKRDYNRFNGCHGQQEKLMVESAGKSRYNEIN